jgi:hypothetical protein
VTRALEITKEVECQVLEASPSLVPFQPNLSCQLSTHGHGHAAKDMLHTSSNCRLDTIQFLGCVAKQMIASAFFVDQAFEATEIQKILKAFTLIC